VQDAGMLASGAQQLVSVPCTWCPPVQVQPVPEPQETSLGGVDIHLLTKCKQHHVIS
jgi:hypothetical protein